MRMTYRNFIVITCGALGLWIMMFPVRGICYTPTPAELTSNLYLRRHPGRNANILMLLIQGSHVTVQDENGSWAEVAYETHGKKTGKATGWVDKQYLKIMPVPPAQDTTAPSPVVASPPAASPVTVNATAASHPVRGDRRVAPGAPSASGVSASSAPVSVTPPGEKQGAIISRPLPPVTDKTHILPFSVSDVSAFFKKFTEIPETDASARESGVARVSTYDVIRVIARLLLEFSLVCVSCLALLFSYSAMRAVRAMHYQR